MTRYASRPLDDKMRNFYDIRRSMSPRERPFAEELEQIQRDAFGWTFEEKYRQINQEKYMPLIREIMESKQSSDAVSFGEKTVLPQLKKIMREAEWFNQNTFGGCSRYGGCSRGVEVKDIHVRPKPEEVKGLDRDEQDKLEINGFHLDNDRIKDIFEDAEDVLEDVETLLDPHGPYMTEGIKLDAALRFSPKV